MKKKEEKEKKVIEEGAINERRKEIKFKKGIEYY